MFYFFSTLFLFVAIFGLIYWFTRQYKFFWQIIFIATISVIIFNSCFRVNVINNGIKTGVWTYSRIGNFGFGIFIKDEWTKSRWIGVGFGIPFVIGYDYSGEFIYQIGIK